MPLIVNIALNFQGAYRRIQLLPKMFSKLIFTGCYEWEHKEGEAIRKLSPTEFYFALDESNIVVAHLVIKTKIQIRIEALEKALYDVSR